MGLSFLRFFQPKNGKTSSVEVPCNELFEAAAEYQIRELCFWTCVNMIANAIGRCEFRTYVNGKEVKDREYYLWNYEPNANQNSTAFWHKFVARLCQDNEALIISVPGEGRYDDVVVADDWEEPLLYPSRANEYKGVTVGEVTYNETFYESDVIHITLNHMDMYSVISKLYQSYYRLVQAAIKNYEWEKGQHWKVHVDQLTQNAEGWNKAFAEMIQQQIKPFFESNGAILPEFDGYKYENVGGTTNGRTADKGTRDIKELIEDIFDFTARGFGIPSVLAKGTVENTKDANSRFLTGAVDPLCDQLQEEITRKRYGFEGWKRGSYVRVDSSAIIHFDLFEAAANIEKLVGSAAFSINDIRRALGESTINEPWADEHFLTKNIGNVTALGAQEGGTGTSGNQEKNVGN